MFFAYAVIHTTPIVIATLTAIGLICWGVGQYRAYYLWDKTDAACDAVDEYIYEERQREQRLAKMRLELENSEKELAFRGKMLFAMLVKSPDRSGLEVCPCCDGQRYISFRRCGNCNGYGMLEEQHGTL